MTRTLLTRRTLLAAGGSVIGAAGASKPAAAQDPAPPSVEMRPLSAILPAKPPSTLPEVALRTLDGASAPLAAYGGRIVVLNFWATWCVPCVAELPELDRLAASGGFAVLAASADRAGATAVKPFALAHAITHLTLLLDQGSDAVHALGVGGFPTTLIIGPDRKLRGTLEGPAAWSGAGRPSAPWWPRLSHLAIGIRDDDFNSNGVPIGPRTLSRSSGGGFDYDHATICVTAVPWLRSS